MQMRKGFLEDSKSGNPHLCWREGVHPHHKPNAVWIGIGLNANFCYLIRCFYYRLKNYLARDSELLLKYSTICDEFLSTCVSVWGP